MDYHKGYLNLMRTHEPGKFVSFPSRSNAHDLGRRPQFTAATVGLLLCVKEKRLQISGAPLKPGRRYGPKGEVARAKPAPAAAAWKSPKVAAPKPAAEKKPKPKVKAGAIDTWDAKLRARIAEARGAGRKLRFRFSMVGGDAELASLEGEQGVKIRSGGSLMALAWSTLSLDDRKGIALALAEWGGIPDFAVAGFYCLATGSVEKGERFLARAGAAADEVRAAFD
jgi:hypothetical protein